MKRRFLATIALVLVLSMALSGCAVLDAVKNFLQGTFGPDIELTDAPLNAEKVIDFANGADADVFFESDGWSNGDVFNVVWKSHNVQYADGVMKLGITEEKATAWLNDQEVEFDYTAGEARSQNYYHYGDYVVSMKPSANPGTASTFFLCTGPYDVKRIEGEDGTVVEVANPHDEIDIEFLGKDTTHVQFNFFVNGVGGNEYMFDLGFDASEEFHEYGFRWLPDSITWFVDGEPVYKVTTDKTVKEGKNVRIVDVLPQTAGRMLGNYWCGNERAWAWMGRYDGNVNDDGCEYQWIATSAEGAPLNPPAPPVVTDEIDWTAIEAIAPGFASAEKYTVAIDGNKANVTYTDVGGSDYKPIEMDVTELSAGKNYVHMKVTNNGSETVNVRLNMYDPTLTGNNTATNVSATMNGEPVFTDLAWGGSFFDIPAGETAELVVKFDVGGIKLQLMIDSSRNDALLRSGDITVEDIKFATVGTVEPPHTCEDADGDNVCDECGKDMPVPPPEHPDSGNLMLDFGDFTTAIGGNVTNGYGINVDENNNIKVDYYSIAGNSYYNFWANVASVAGTKNVFSMKVTNHGTEAVKLRIDIESQTQTSTNTTCCNLSATQDGNAAFTDLEWGGSIFTIEPGATSTLAVTYDASALPTNVKIMVDSCQWDDTTSHSGSITISELNFSGEYTPVDPTNPTDPEPTMPAPEFSDIYVEFKTENNYTLESAEQYTNSVHVTYSDIVGGSWSNVNIWVDDKSEGCTIFSLKLKNDGVSDVSVWTKIQDASGGELKAENLVIAAGTEATYVMNYTGHAQMIFFFIDSTHTVEAGASFAGDITISNLQLGKLPATEEPTDPTTPTEPQQPVEGEYLSFTGNLETYTLSAGADEYVNTVQVTYTAASTNTWHNVNTWVKDKAAGKTNAFVTIKNNGTETVLITVKLEDSNKAEVGLAKIDIAPGASENVTVKYNADPDLLFFFIDTDWSETTTTHAGDITISGIHFE